MVLTWTVRRRDGQYSGASIVAWTQFFSECYKTLLTWTATIIFFLVSIVFSLINGLVLIVHYGDKCWAIINGCFYVFIGSVSVLIRNKAGCFFLHTIAFLTYALSFLFAAVIIMIMIKLCMSSTWFFLFSAVNQLLFAVHESNKSVNNYRVAACSVLISVTCLPSYVIFSCSSGCFFYSSIIFSCSSGCFFYSSVIFSCSSGCF